jgi:hypothetical protein
MPWARFEDGYLGSRKLTALSTGAIALDMASIVYSARELRDGVLSVADVEVVTSLIHIRKWHHYAVELVEAQRWAPREEGGFIIHDYLDYQPSREQVLADRAAGAERKRRQRASNGHFVSGRTDTVTPGGLRQESPRSHNAPVPGPGPGRPSDVPDSPKPPLLDADAQGASPTASAPPDDDDGLAVIHATAGICPFCRLPYTGSYLDHTAEKHRVHPEPGPGNLGQQFGHVGAPPPEVEAQFAAMHERLQSLPQDAS